MRVKILLAAILLSTIMIVDSVAQQLPLVYSVENTSASYPKPPLPTVDQLPINQSLPDPFVWADGRGRITSINDWLGRRAEIKAQIENYEIGPKPPRPDTITASYTGGKLTVNVTKNGRTLVLTSNITLPSGTGPFPALIGMNSPNGSIAPASIFSSRNIVQITFSHNQVTTYGGPKPTDPYYQLYPNLNADNTGQYSAWAWGVSRLIDGLELVQNVLPIDLKHLAVSGCSYAGKMALFSGAFDERIALTIALESGGGGATSWRYSHSEPAGSVEKVDNTDYNWFMNSMKTNFVGDNVWKMPEDHHELMAMCAPRALLVTANPGQIWLSNPSCYVVSKACQQVYIALGISDRFGFSLIGDHPHCSIPTNQVPEIEAFMDKYLLGKENVNTNVATTTYSINLSPWITWTNPTLSSAPSFLGWTTLVYPANQQKGLDKNITLKWKKVKDAAKYIVLLSTDQTFKTGVKIDSTTTDTVKTVSGLLDGKRYFWRVQVKNSAGTSGPLSDIWYFSTYIQTPTASPQLLSATSVKDRPNIVTLKWRSVKNADQYLIRLSDDQTFASYLIADSSGTDTTKTLQSLFEGTKYYWRAQAKNVGGTGPWSDVSNFTTKLLTPTGLALKKSGVNEITLTWNDNSMSEYGYIIERKISPQTSFTLLDTTYNSFDYIDKKVLQTQTYSYRIKAFGRIAESDYSNETSLNFVGVKHEDIPTEYSISQNYPNPFNPTTKLKFALPQRSFTKLAIYDLLGREVKTLINKEMEAGYHEIVFDAGSFPSGVYFYKIQSGDYVQTKKMILMK